MPSKSKSLSVAEMCAEAPPQNDVEHFVVCPVCGQMFDCRDQDQVRHHTTSREHEPLYAGRPP